MQNVHIFLNKHKRERVFFSFPPNSGIPSENIADMPPGNTVCVFFQDLHHQEANFLQDSDTHLSSGCLLKACFLENQYVSSNTFRQATLFVQGAHRIRHTPKPFRGNKNIQ